MKGRASTSSDANTMRKLRRAATPAASSARRPTAETTSARNTMAGVRQPAV
jgi:hypothetical protein